MIICIEMSYNYYIYDDILEFMNYFCVLELKFVEEYGFIIIYEYYCYSKVQDYIFLQFVLFLNEYIKKEVMCEQYVGSFFYFIDEWMFVLSYVMVN